eukprot:6179843-Pleurochrysis_carterae.AAC.6
MLGVIAVSVTYSSRPNDTDIYHRGAIVPLLAHRSLLLRVAYCLPRARPFSLFYAFCVGLQQGLDLPCPRGLTACLPNRVRALLGKCSVCSGDTLAVCGNRNGKRSCRVVGRNHHHSVHRRTVPGDYATD